MVLLKDLRGEEGLGSCGLRCLLVLLAKGIDQLAGVRSWLQVNRERRFSRAARLQLSAVAIAVKLRAGGTPLNITRLFVTLTEREVVLVVVIELAFILQRHSLLLFYL